MSTCRHFISSRRSIKFLGFYLILIFNSGNIVTADETAELVKLIEEQVAQIPLIQFEGDPILLQNVDRVNGIANYKLPRSADVLYTHDEVDGSKISIAFFVGKDGSEVPKRRFLLLRQTAGNKKEYYAGFAYIRLADAMDSNVFNVANMTVCIEYAAWDNRDDKKNALTAASGWTDCQFTVYIPCVSKETELIKLSLGYKIKSEKKSHSGSDISNNTGAKTSSSEVAIISEPEEDVNSQQFFGDLEDNPLKAHYVGQSVGFILNGKITTSAMQGQAQALDEIKSGKVGPDELSVEQLQALIASHRGEPISNGMTVAEYVTALYYQTIGAGNEQFMPGGVEYEVEILDDGDDSKDLLFEVESITPEQAAMQKLSGGSNTSPGSSPSTITDNSAPTPDITPGSTGNTFIVNNARHDFGEGGQPGMPSMSGQSDSAQASGLQGLEIPGQPGATGTVDKNGLTESTGQTGGAGTIGQPGKPSLEGATGISELSGKPGATGQSGAPGSPGAPGQPGVPGKQGAPEQKISHGQSGFLSHQNSSGPSKQPGALWHQSAPGHLKATAIAGKPGSLGQKKVQGSSGKPGALNLILDSSSSEESDEESTFGVGTPNKSGGMAGKPANPQSSKQSAPTKKPDISKKPATTSKPATTNKPTKKTIIPLPAEMPGSGAKLFGWGQPAPNGNSGSSHVSNPLFPQQVGPGSKYFQAGGNRYPQGGYQHPSGSVPKYSQISGNAQGVNNMHYTQGNQRIPHYPQSGGGGNSQYPQGGGGGNSQYPQGGGGGNSQYLQGGGGGNSQYPQGGGGGSSQYSQGGGGGNSQYPQGGGGGNSQYSQGGGGGNSQYSQGGGGGNSQYPKRGGGSYTVSESSSQYTVSGNGSQRTGSESSSSSQYTMSESSSQYIQSQEESGEESQYTQSGGGSQYTQSGGGSQYTQSGGGSQYTQSGSQYSEVSGGPNKYLRPTQGQWQRENEPDPSTTNWWNRPIQSTAYINWSNKVKDVARSKCPVGKRCGVKVKVPEYVDADNYEGGASCTSCSESHFNFALGTGSSGNFIRSSYNSSTWSGFGPNWAHGSNTNGWNPANGVRGRSLTGSVEEPVPVFKDNTVTFMQHPGWKTLNLTIKNNITLDFENTPFFGFGFCPYTAVSQENLENAKTTESISKVYMDVLRIGCIPKEIDSIMVLFKHGCLRVAEKIIEVPTTCRYLMQNKLTISETQELSRAFEMSILSQEFSSQLQHPDPTTLASDGTQISRAVHTLGKIAIHSLSDARLHVRNHIVKLTRNLILTLKSTFVKLLQDSDEIHDNCEDCASDKEINENDRHYILSLIEFAIREVGVGKKRSKQDIQAAFENFFSSNKKAIRARLSDYKT